MHSQPADERGNEALTFEESLTHFILDSYTNGHTIEGEWAITVPITDAPNWEVTISKSYSAEAPSYQPTILDE